MLLFGKKGGKTIIVRAETLKTLPLLQFLIACNIQQWKVRYYIQVIKTGGREGLQARLAREHVRRLVIVG